MKSVILTTLIALTTMGILAGCDKPDYQDPRYRSGQAK
jgi:hypothetical protein